MSDKIGTRLEYLRTEYKVIEDNPLHIKMVPIGSEDKRVITVYKGSNRYKKIFPNEEHQHNSLAASMENIRPADLPESEDDGWLETGPVTDFIEMLSDDDISKKQKIKNISDILLDQTYEDYNNYYFLMWCFSNKASLLCFDYDTLMASFHKVSVNTGRTEVDYDVYDMIDPLLGKTGSVAPSMYENLAKMIPGSCYEVYAVALDAWNFYTSGITKRDIDNILDKVSELDDEVEDDFEDDFDDEE
jgi:hypothetical protein